MASIKLGQLLNLGAGLLRNSFTNQQTKAMAQNLLQDSKLELRDKKAPLSHMRSDPLAFTNINETTVTSDYGNAKKIFATV